MTPGAVALDGWLSVYHDTSGPTTEWSRVNTAEAIVGVQTPLSWDVWRRAGDHGFRHAYGRLLLLDRATVRDVPTGGDGRPTAVFYGRAATNLSIHRRAWVSLRDPSADDGAEWGFFASESAQRVEGSARRRRVVRAVLPLSMAASAQRLGRVRSRGDTFWKRSVPALASTTGVGGALALFDAAVGEMTHAVTAQIYWSTLASVRHAQMRQLLDGMGRPDLELALLAGFNEIEELRLTRALWHAARSPNRREALVEFTGQYGFHGPDEGELSSVSWRQDATPLLHLLDAYASMSDDASPDALDAARRVKREATLRELFPGRDLRTARNRRIVERASDLIALRSVAKAAFTQAFDIARGAARRLGGHLVDRGDLADPEDVFYLTAAELRSVGPHHRDIVAARRSCRQQLGALQLPLEWTGVPQPLQDAADEAAPRAERLITGVGVSPGCVSGPALVATDANIAATTMHHGDVLVCPTTDPSWASCIVLASALVLDIGGPLSHGAIVARELGIPCVANTASGTALIRSGDRLLVDADQGQVRIEEWMH
jgi:pyruvate,water dikinase